MKPMLSRQMTQSDQLGHFAADNADHNTNTLDDKNTLRVMGVVI